jgi:adenylosuccinate lyase
VDGLVVDAARMRENLEASYGLVFSQRVLSVLVTSGLERDEAYRLVQRNAARAWDEGIEFRALLEADPEINLAPAELDEAFDVRALLRHVDVIFERLAALPTPTPKEEAVHA